ncbi:MAG TPA: ABC transporter permease [Nitrososphaerales archaeon]|nr:ABC transporter permease [Nitrososphaerales archaeon]
MTAPPSTTTRRGILYGIRSGNGFASILLRTVLKRRDVKVGLGILIFFVALDIVSVFYLPHNPRAPVSLGGVNPAPPSAKFWFGTTDIGQDVFSQWMYGTQATLLVGFLAALLTAVLGITTGIVAGYINIWDEPLMRAADVILTLPALPLLIVVASFYKTTDYTVALLIAFLAWAGMSRTLRSAVLSLKHQAFVEVAELSNVPRWKIMFVDMFKHTLPLILTYSLFAVGGAILTVASLDFIGVGPVTDYSWGSMISLANDASALLDHPSAWWWPIPPGLSIAILVTGLALIAYGLEAAFKNM